MSCILRVSGKKFKLDEFLKTSFLKPLVIFRKGEPKRKTNPSGKKFYQDGVNILISNAGFDKLRLQIKSATKFLKQNKKELRRIIVSKRILGEMAIDFGIQRRDVAVQCDEFPSELLKLAGDLGINIQLSQYPE